MRARSLALTLVIVLLVGTLFAWGNFAYEFVQWRGGVSGIGCVEGVANPFMTPCFYGALVFTLAFVLSVALWRSLPTIYENNQAKTS